MRETIAAVGGYWRPLAGLARLLEELGELAADLATTAARDAVEAELADIWIISTVLADQFLGDVAEPRSESVASGEAQQTLLELFACAAPVARIVNYYDGPKVPRSGDELGSLNDAVARLHAALGRLAATLEVDLRSAVARKLDEIGTRDRWRFAAAGHDPSSAAVLTDFLKTCGPHTSLKANPRLWGAPDGSNDEIGARAGAISRDLLAFTRAARPERIDGYVIGAPQTAPASWLSELLCEVGVRQTPNALLDHCSDGRSELSFMGTPLTVYWPPAPGAPPEANAQLAVLQPEHKRFGVSRPSPPAR